MSKIAIFVSGEAILIEMIKYIKIENISANVKSFDIKKYFIQSLDSFVSVGFLFGVESSSRKACEN